MKAKQDGRREEEEGGEEKISKREEGRIGCGKGEIPKVERGRGVS